ncbi:MAG: BREX-1 system adenine-specific DNA-methyltransferase PglX [Burkholderiaceae bacterium]|nr:BREX-1 system adenine-specific DNA-methyltransferase PglX [Burkholderiaceae bacterium]
MNPVLDWWSSLNHGGLLIAPRKIQEVFAAPLAPLSGFAADQLRRELTRFDGTDEALSPLLDHVLESLSSLPEQEWQKGPQVESRWAFRSFTGELVKPRRLWLGPNGETLPVFVPEGGVSRHAGARLGVGRSRKLLSRVVEWLRRLNQPLALVTNGRQWRLMHAGGDYDAWCEWDIDLWFEEGQPSAQVLAWRQLLTRDALLAPKPGAPGLLLGAVLDSRKGQAELSAVLGERVRQAVEELITASHAAIEAVTQQGTQVDYADLYRAGTRIVMRCIITFFAEARGLLPVDNRIYQQSYSLDGLRQQLDRRSGGRGSERLSQGCSAWPRLMALFNLIHQGSAHEALPVPQYGGALFEPGSATERTGVDRALALLESPSNAISDKQVHHILRLLTRTKVKVRQGRRGMWVDGPVDFSALSSEYIGILYEGLLDFELKQADGDDPIVFLGVGREPALPLSRLEAMDDKAIKQLFDELKKKDKGPAATEGDDDAGEDGADEAEAEGPDADETDVDEEVVDETAAADDAADIDTEPTDHLLRAQTWLERAAEVAGLVKRPRGRAATMGAEYEEARRRAGRQLCARLVAPGQFYLVRWGGTRKGAGTFYTRPQLAAPTVRRTLQALAFEPASTETNPATGLVEVTAWRPRRPEDILALKICDPAMGSGSFLAGSLRFLVDALVQSLYFHGRIERQQDGAVARLADGQAAEGLGSELLPFPPDHEAFEDALRARLKRHIVERCIYGVDIDPLAVELGRMALWVETMDRSLPFGFLDHKLKVGNGLVGAWFDTFQEYPAMAWEREGGDGNHERFVHHFHTVTATRGRNAGRTEKQGDVWTAAIKACRSQVQQELIAELNGQLRLGDATLATGVHAELVAVFDRLHQLPVHDTEARARLYQEQVLSNPHYHALKARLDLWCALWFWPGDEVDVAPLPSQFGTPSAQALDTAARVAQARRFFHWELEFPDVFTPQRSGFDAVLGNPPWEIQKPNSKEFFSNIDPLYRAYGKQEALGKQVDYFTGSAQIEEAWLRYNAALKAMSNWVKCVGHPFGDKVYRDNNGNEKHEINLGGRGRDSFAVSKRLHDKWRARRQQRASYADRAHPFLHQGSADLNTYKMFMELSHALLKPAGRLGMITPSGLYTDKGSTALRTLLLDRCDWQWLFGFENREKVFDIDSRFKFCPVIVQKGGQTQAIRAAFMHRDVDDWNHAEGHVMAYPRERVIEFSPYSKAILEIRTEQDLKVLQKIYANGVLLGDQSERGWGVKYATEFHMTNDSKLFPERPKWEAKGYQPDEYGHWLKGSWRDYSGPAHILERPEGLVLSRDGRQAIHVEQIEDVALPLYEGRMIGQFDFSEKGWVSGKGRKADWRDQPLGQKQLDPQYLMGRGSYLSALAEATKSLVGLKAGYLAVGSATNSRSMFSGPVAGFPAGNSVAVLQSTTPERTLALIAALNSFAYDFALRTRLGGLNLNYFILAETPLPSLDQVTMQAAALNSIRLSLPHQVFAAQWLPFRSEDRGWRRSFALTVHERRRLQAINDALIATTLGLSDHDFRQVIADCDLPVERLTGEAAKALNPKGFWRTDKDLQPELRHPVLAFVAFCDLQDKGLEGFLSQNQGDGWLIPEQLCLGDFALGRDARSREHHPVASQFGPRLFDWQVNEDVSRSWQECAAHAAIVKQLVPVEAVKYASRDDDPPADGVRRPEVGYQSGLF